MALCQLPDGLEAQLRASASAFVDVPAGEQACSVLRNRASIPCELFSGRIVQAMLASTQALAGRAAANLAHLRAAASAMTPAELAVPAWMARFQEQPRLLDEHLVAAYTGVTASGASLRTALEAGTVCDQAYLGFIQQSNGDLARFLCQEQYAMALMRQDVCGRFFACCCLVGELLVDVLGFQVTMLQLQLGCVEEKEASAASDGAELRSH